MFKVAEIFAAVSDGLALQRRTAAEATAAHLDTIPREPRATASNDTGRAGRVALRWVPRRA